MENNLKHRGGNDKVLFIPDHVIDSYVVMKHTHPGHQVFEIGHETFRISTHSDYQSGMQGLFDAIKAEPEHFLGYRDFSLCGTYKGTMMKFDAAGDVMGDTGFLVSYAFPPNRRMGETEWRIDPVFNPSSTFALTYPASFYSDSPSLIGPEASINQEVHDKIQQECNNRSWMVYDAKSGELSINDFAFGQNQLAAEHEASNMRDGFEIFGSVELKSLPDVIKGITYGVPPPLWYEEPNQLILTQKFSSDMNEKVLEYHKNDLRKIGMGDSLDEALSMNIKSGKPDFKLYSTKEFGEDLAVVTLPYRRSTREGSDMIFRNGMELLVRPKVGDIQRQTFTQDKDSGNITVKNAYNAMQQRSFLLDKDTDTWAYLNFKETDKNGNHPMETVSGYDIRKIVGPLPISDLKDPEKADTLYASLERGNRQHVEVSGKSFFIEALPKYETLRVYTGNLQKSNIEELKKAADLNQSTDQTNNQVQQATNTQRQRNGQSQS
ncbi:hypothetical protein ACE38W_17385 [Chitinophaga sp. Hz27]|uniref:hypothetical protein n=1 Tax=Chitinophaga sp. Hz27 TaxID=3347169 RepID=UPI0035DBF9F2